MNVSHTIVLPRIMEIGHEACQKLPEVLRSLAATKPLIITDKVMVQLGYVDKIQTLLAAVGITADVFDDTVPEPTDSSITAGVARIQNGDYDVIIALGGGSPIDSAKAIAILGKFGGEIRDYKFPRQVHESGVPIVAIPTTAGTGSEVTKFTIITDEANNEK